MWQIFTSGAAGDSKKELKEMEYWTSSVSAGRVNLTLVLFVSGPKISVNTESLVQFSAVFPNIFGCFGWIFLDD